VQNDLFDPRRVQGGQEARRTAVEHQLGVLSNGQYCLA